MPTQHLTALGSAEVLFFDAHGDDRFGAYLRSKGFHVLDVDDPATGIKVARQGTVRVAVLILSEGLQEAALCRVLKEGADPPAVIVICERDLTEALRQKLPEGAYPDHVFVKPAPHAKLLHEVERLLAQDAQQGDTELPALLFAKIVADLWRRSATGRLRATAEGVETIIHFREGTAVFAEQGTLGDTLGRQLLRTGKITMEQFSRAVELITERMVDNEQMRLGEALIELGAMTPEGLHHALTEQTRNKIIACFGWPRFHCDFREDAELIDRSGDFPSPTGQLVLDGLKTVNPALLEQYLEPFNPRYPRLAQALWELNDRIEMHDREQSFILSVTGKRTLRQLRNGASLDRVHAAQLLSALVVIDALEFADAPWPATGEAPSVARAAPAPAPEPEPAATAPNKQADRSRLRSAMMSLYLRVKGRADHEVLEVAPDASPEEVSESYQRRTNELAALADEASEPEVKQQLAAVGAHIKGAHDRLVSGTPSARPTKRPSEETRRLLEAEKLHQEGKALLAMGQLQAALDAFDAAVAQNAGSLEDELLATWIRYRTADKERARKTQAKRAVELAQQLYSQDGKNGPANLVLGHFMVVQKKFERARRHLLLAIEYDPALADANVELRELEKKRRG